ncbi:MAG TPA: hypothetical protein VN848_05615 [Gemmatimonadales bacterium]|nr:hypothetical protein [Gemmatimonadales bacterium]
MRRVMLWTVVYALAMAFVEAAVVVYLRELTHGGPFADPATAILPPHILAIEAAREASTIVMLVAVGWLAGRDLWERGLVFLLAFAIWDLAYYAWLWVLIGWPSSLLDWDVLFLIPVPWTAPVLAPVLASLELVGGVAALLRLSARRERPAFTLGSVSAILGGGLIVFGTFVVDFRAASQGRAPGEYHWAVFAVGLLLSGVGLAAAARPRMAS